MKNFEVYKNVPLFKDIDKDHLQTMIECIGSNQKMFEKDEFVFLAGEKPKDVGVLLSGQLHILRECSEGNNLLVGVLGIGEVVAGGIVAAGVEENPVSVIAKTKSTVMFFDFSRILTFCSNSCEHKQKLIRNMLWHVANKNMELQSRLEIVSIKSVRKKILRYLCKMEARQTRTDGIIIPFNRQEMADFLCVERSALSRELAKMKDEGIIDYRKNHFIIINTNCEE